jgi:hypothetical protein
MSEWPAGPANELQRDQKQESETYAAFTIGSVASAYYNNCAGDVPLKNVPNVECSGSEPGGEVKRVMAKPSLSAVSRECHEVSGPTYRLIYTSIMIA